MKGNEIAALMDEPACGHKLQKPKSGCSAPKPGATAGGCVSMVQITLLPYRRCCPSAAGPIGCTGSSWITAAPAVPALHSIVWLYHRFKRTRCDHGAVNAVCINSVKHIVDRYHPAAVFVYNTCVPAMEGDDIIAICKAAETKVGVPVILRDAAGFYGGKT